MNLHRSVGRRAVSAAAAGVGAPGSDAAASLPDAIDQAAFQDAQGDPRVLAVFAKWSACMRVDGYDYATPFTAGADGRWMKSAAASPLEIQVAGRDISGKLETNLLGVEFAVQSAYEAVAIGQNSRALAAVKAQLAAQGPVLSGLMGKYAGS